MPDKKKISFCITCKGRAEHLKQTLPQNLKNTRNYPNVEFVVLDYDSQDGLGDWIREHYQAEIASGKIRYAKFEPAPHFRMAHAKNMSHRVATGEILCNLDADNILHKHFCGWLNKQFRENPNICVYPTDLLIQAKRLYGDPQRGANGRVALHRDNFMRLHGYDERRFEGWANDDADLIQRAAAVAIQGVGLPWYMLGSTIQHDNAARTENLSPTSRKASDNLLGLSRVGRALKMRDILANSSPANPDGNFGCGKVRINFQEDLDLTPCVDPHFGKKVTRIGRGYR
jgi:glycosyltransferase involved in cell wall biosynthesis